MGTGTSKDEHSRPRWRRRNLDVASSRAGALAVFSRYHTLPQKVEDDYDILEDVLGAGMNGNVQAATAKGGSGQKRFAVKGFKLKGLDLKQRGMLDAEVAVFLGMDHPHVARLLDIYETDDTLHLVMECLEGGELLARLNAKGKYSEVQAGRAIFQMLLVVNYLHGCGIVHRDLKLENFMYEKVDGDHLKLIDFGFSNVFTADQKYMTEVMGTMAYAAPELLKGKYTLKADMWSLGVIAYILLSGSLPFEGKSDDAVKELVLKGQYKMPDAQWGFVSPEGVEFVKALLNTDADARLSAAAALHHPWIEEREQGNSVAFTAKFVQGLQGYASASKFRKACLQSMAWSVSAEDKAKVRKYFTAMDTDMQGTISLAELKAVLEEASAELSEKAAEDLMQALCSTNSLRFSDFLAAMVSTRIQTMHGDVLHKAFRRFDFEKSGFITVKGLRQVIGGDATVGGSSVKEIFAEATELQGRRKLSYDDFVAVLSGNALEPLTAEEAAKQEEEEEEELRKEAEMKEAKEPSMKRSATLPPMRGADSKPALASLTRSPQPSPRLPTNARQPSRPDVVMRPSCSARPDAGGQRRRSAAGGGGQSPRSATPSPRTRTDTWVEYDPIVRGSSAAPRARFATSGDISMGKSRTMQVQTYTTTASTTSGTHLNGSRWRTANTKVTKVITIKRR